MNNEELPDYKQNFLREMEELRQQQLREQQPEGNSILAPPPVRKYPLLYSASPKSRTTSSTLRSTPLRPGSST